MQIPHNFPVNLLKYLRFNAKYNAIFLESVVQDTRFQRKCCVIVQNIRISSQKNINNTHYFLNNKVFTQ